MTLTMESDAVLKVEDLRVYFKQDQGTVRAVDGVSFTVYRGKVLGIIGESGCGKSVTVHTVMRLLPSPPAQIVGGRILYDPGNGKAPLDLAALPPKGKEMRNIRGREIGMIFQEPMTAFSPVHTIGNQLVEAIRVHEPNVSKEDAEARIQELLKRVDLHQTDRVMKAYPHQLSGGMRQRAMIAMALACSPKLLIADEPTTALDVTIQAQILELLVDLQAKYGMTIILITHDLGVVAETCQRAVVMYAGQIVEESAVDELFASPKHPYTYGLLRSIPKIGESKKRLYTIPGVVPDLRHMPQGCRFHPRCEKMSEKCQMEEPPSAAFGHERRVKCWHPY